MAKLAVNKDHLVSSSDPKNPLPFADNCRAVGITSISKFAVCLASSPPICGYVFYYGDGFYCCHPHCKEIVSHTLQRAKTGLSGTKTSHGTVA